MNVFFPGGLGFEQISFVSTVKSLAQFLVDQISHLVLSNILLFVRHFSAFANHVIHYFITVSTRSTLAIQLRIINFASI